MTKYLRQVEFRGFLRSPTEDERAENTYSFFTAHNNSLTGLWAYFRYALPVSCQGVTKINLYGCPIPGVVCEEPLLGIASVWVDLPQQLEESSSCSAQQRFMVQLAHHGMTAASNRYGFSLSSFADAKDRVEAEGFRLEYQIGKTKTSPDRKLTASIVCYFDNGYRTDLVLNHRDGSPLTRFQFATADELIVSQVAWLDNSVLRVSSKGFADSYWDCHVDGTVNFVYGHADPTSPHHLYRHACLLLDEYAVLPDRTKGLQLLQQAAEMGYAHAKRRIRS